MIIMIIIMPATIQEFMTPGSATQCQFSLRSSSPHSLSGEQHHHNGNDYDDGHEDNGDGNHGDDRPIGEDNESKYFFELTFLILVSMRK